MLEKIPVFVEVAGWSGVAFVHRSDRPCDGNFRI
jgi:hypothetical protein